MCGYEVSYHCADMRSRLIFGRFKHFDTLGLNPHCSLSPFLSKTYMQTWGIFPMLYNIVFIFGVPDYLVRD